MADFIASTTLNAVLGAKRGIVSISTTTTISEALEILSINKIHSVAVHDKGGFRGIANRMDLLLPVAFDSKLGENPDFKQSVPVFQTPVEGVLGLTRESKHLHQFFGVDTLPDLIQAFAQGVHSVLVNDADGKPMGFLSQFDVVVYLHKNKDKLAEWTKTATALDLNPTIPVRTLAADVPALKAFRELLIDSIGAAPVVGADGKVVATLSLSDVAKIDRSNLANLLKPVPDFLKAMHGSVRETISAESKDSVASVLEKVATSGVHQIWLLENGKPTGCISLTDIIKTFLLRADFGPLYYSQHKAYSQYFAQNPKLQAEHEELFGINVESLLKGKDAAVTVDSKLSQGEVLELLAKNRILSVPVLGQDKKVVGLASALDILTVLVLDPQLSAPDQVDAKLLESRLTTLKDPINGVIGATGDTDLALSFDAKDKLTSLLNSFCQGVHRVVIGSGDKQYIVSQTDVLRYFLQNVAKLGPVSKQRVDELVNTRDAKLTKISSDSTALSAFRQIVVAGAAAAPIVDSKGALVAGLSSSDVRGLTTARTKELLLPVLEFLGKEKEVGEPVTVAPETTLVDVIKKLIGSKVHRAWVVDGDKLVGVISMSDIIGAIYLDKVTR